MGVHLGKAASAKYYLEDDLAVQVEYPSWRSWIRAPDWRGTTEADWLAGDYALFAEALTGRRRGRALSPGLGQGGKRQRGYDIDISADKAVSVLWALADDPTERARLLAAHRRAVLAVADAIAAVPCSVRAGAGGRFREPAQPPIALVSHILARPQACDGFGVVAAPHLHDHAVVANLARRSDGSLRSLAAKPLYRAVASLDRLYREVLDRELAELGLEPSREEGRLRLPGLDERLVVAFSPRRQALLAASVGLGAREGARLRAALARTARLPKSREDLATLRAKWATIAQRVLETAPTAEPAPFAP